jgi:AraC family transcriptional regulator of adaptative response/methylated-DNA-[protein]-cysteine methyltransferase
MTDRPTFDTEESRWRAVAGRNPAADGCFVYAVRTTGVFCRPGCSSRRPKRGNVTFFADAAAARLAGFRPCRRCRPELASPLEGYRDRIVLACRSIEQSAQEPPLAQLAGEAGLSPGHFQRLFRAIVGITPKQYAKARRLDRFRAGLKRDASVTDAVYAAGFGSSSRAYENVAARLGMPPAAYRKGAAGVVIRHATAPCSLGWVLVAATGRGICAIELADDPVILLDRLRLEFPGAALEPAAADFSATVAAVTGLIETPATGLALPLDIRGTAFQRRVWEALGEVPAGRTVSYAELARRVGNPRAARAVAQACAGNRLAVAVPCHRAVDSDGALRGYRWGLERKRALLQREATGAAEPAFAGEEPRKA